MYTNAPTPELYRVAELRRNEEMSRAAERRRQRMLLEPSRPGWFATLRNLVGRGLIATGQWITPSADTSTGANQLATT